MTTADSGSESHASTPPQIPPPAVQMEERSAWPTVLGVLSLIYAALGSCMALFGVGALVFNEQLLKLGGMEVEMPSTLRVLGAVSGVLSAALGVLLFVAAIGLLRRRRSGVFLAKAWIVLRLLLALAALGTLPLTAAGQIGYQQAIQEEAERIASQRGQQSMVPVKTEEELRRSTYTWGVVGGAVAITYPIVLGWWLTRRRIRDEVADQFE